MVLGSYTGKLEAGDAYLGSHSNTWAVRRITCNKEAGEAYLGSDGNLVTWRLGTHI